MARKTTIHAGLRQPQIGGRAALARCSEFPRGHESVPHRHDEAQFVLAADGAMIMDTDEGALIVPPNRAAWIPPGVIHNARMIGEVSTVTIWIERIPHHDLPTKCRVVNVAPNLHRLLKEAMKVGKRGRSDSHSSGAVGQLLSELETLPQLPAKLPLPKDSQLAAQCQSFLRGPSARETINDWSAALRMSRRTFTRRFRLETGLSFGEWRQQACLFAVLPRLAAGESITSIAIDLGYESPTAFTTMFKRHQGVPPSRCF